MSGLAWRWSGVGLVVFLGCSSGDTAGSVGRRGAQGGGPAEPRAEPMPHEECVARGGNIESTDVNNDGQPDLRSVLEGGRVVCRESDLNFDGRVDVLRWLDASGRTTRVEDDYDFDGRIDAVITYVNGEPSSDVLDTNFDGRTDTWRTYRGGRVVELRRDADGDGAVDTWERFDDTGRLTYAALDANHDGRPDEEPDADAGTPPQGGGTSPQGGGTSPQGGGTSPQGGGTTPPAAASPTTPPLATPPPATPPPATTAPATTAPGSGKRPRRVR